ncbi:hypothetical protein UY3_11849 [Chelonia mydas]|uniref:Uncharacterized protein n=1 Tax=Chelonia mydas TaxID=8469 RepID=M7BSC8_CHEMY|nr:hypothetical protein UY3_11849 [Chelonia mydas]
MASRIHPTVPSPPHTRIRKSGTSRKKFSLRTETRSWVSAGARIPAPHSLPDPPQGLVTPQPPGPPARGAPTALLVPLTPNPQPPGTPALGSPTALLVPLTPNPQPPGTPALGSPTPLTRPMPFDPPPIHAVELPRGVAMWARVH